MVLILLAGKVPLYAYEFRDQTAPSMFPELPDFKPMAYHTADLQYQFPGFHGGDKGVQHPLNAQQPETFGSNCHGMDQFRALRQPEWQWFKSLACIYQRSKSSIIFVTEYS